MTSTNSTNWNLGTLVPLALAAVFWNSGSAHAQSCPASPSVDITSPAAPTDVCIPSGFGGNPIAFFDDFSWRSFVALVWPAKTGQRGDPDTSQQVGGAGPRVFETYKMLHELFLTNGSAPGAWNSYDAPAFNACGVQMAFGDLTLASFSKFANLGQAGLGRLVGPIVAQNKTYVRYETGFNQSLFDQIVAPQWYLRAKLPKSITFANGSIDIKSSWVDMTNLPNPNRYYTRDALLADPITGKCVTSKVGLVGLHIVQKTPSRPQWIWSTFEQVDNVPPAQKGAPGAFGFNDGSGAPMPIANPYTLNSLTASPAPFNITRKFPVDQSTQRTNAAYQAALVGTPWQFYQLTMTQWPLVAGDPTIPGTPGNTFPGTGATTAFANTTLETFDQDRIQTGCMNCHNSTRVETDFLWSLSDHAFPSNVPNLLLSADLPTKALLGLILGNPHTEAMESERKLIEMQNAK